MRRLLLTVAAVAVLAGCGSEVSDLIGGDTCSTNPAKTQISTTSCTVAPGNVTFNVTLCSLCNDSQPSCIAELVGNTVEVQPVVKQCQSNAGCAASGCNAAASRATCSLSGLSAGSYQLAIVTDQLQQGTLTVSGGSSTCTL